MKPPHPPRLVCRGRAPCWVPWDIFQQDPPWLLCRLSPSGPSTSPSSGCPGLSSISAGPKVFAEMMEIGMISNPFWHQVASCKDWGKSCLVWGLSQPEKLMDLNKYPLRDQLTPGKALSAWIEILGMDFGHLHLTSFRIFPPLWFSTKAPFKPQLPPPFSPQPCLHQPLQSAAARWIFSDSSLYLKQF